MESSKGQSTGSSQAAKDIEDALNSPDPDKRFEGQIAQELRDSGIKINSFQKKFGPNGSIGEIDIETDCTIVEVTTRESKKLSQVNKLMSNRIINPDNKPVVLYAPGYGETAGKAINDAGAYVARTPEQLLQLIRKLGG